MPIKMPKVLHILLSDYKVDSRVRNETESLSQHVSEITVFCLRSRETLTKEMRNGVQIRRFGLFSNHKIMLILTAYFQFFIAAIGKKFRLVHAHDFTALPVAFLISKVMKIPLIYDSHELWSESKHENYPQLIIRTAHYVERYFAKKASYIITVSDSINYYLQKYFKNRKILTVRNIPSYTFLEQSDILRKRHSIAHNIPVFIYEGLLSQERGIDIILVALSKIKDLKFKFIFLGTGPYIQEIETYVKNHNLSSKIILANTVPQSELLKYIKGADIGVHAISNTCLNHDYCLPNKLFEYIHAGLGVLCTDLTEMSRMIKRYQIGVTFKDKNSDDLSERMRYLITHSEDVRRYKLSSICLAESLTWENEFKQLKLLYEKLLAAESANLVQI